MNYKMIAYSIGRILLVVGMTMLIPLGLAIFYREDTIWAHIVPILICFAAGAAALVWKPKNRSFHAREGMVLVGISWIVISLIGALPFYLSRQIPSFVDCFFETVSGFTTTGSTILSNVEALSKSMLFWRSFTHWLGGLGVLAFTMAIFSSKDSKTSYMMKAEMPGPVLGKLTSSWTFSLRILYIIYIILTLLEVVFLLFGGMNLYDSVLHACSTAGTGGFSNWNSSIAHYDSAYIDYVISIFMLLFGINFKIYFLILARKFAQLKANEELRWYLIIIAVSSLIITINLLPMYKSFAEALRYAFFQVNSIITTTGFGTADIASWPMLSQIIIVVLMIIGACAGSTGGGLKVIRTIVLAKTARYSVRKAVSPRSVFSIKADGKEIGVEVRHGVLAYFAAYAIFMAVAILIVSLDNKDFSTTVTSVISTANNIGPIIGPVGHFADFSVLSKIVFSIAMLVGRLEIYPILVLFSPYMWTRK
ncbi:MAG: TrkH family potassium uptake protein [Clostridia bacterium]|nr:TrkH family potassium uptake protein [Clostridia bacterium]